MNKVMKYLEKRGTNKEWLNTEYHKIIHLKYYNFFLANPMKIVVGI